jgi:radical SAM protein with 4Fe4S-binding SPASM domain
MLLAENSHELDDMQRIADKLGVSFRFDALVFSRFDGDQTPKECRVSMKDAVIKEFSEPRKARQWHEFFKRMSKIPASSKLYQCGAGLTLFHIDSFGMMRPCLMTFDKKHDLLGNGFKGIWYSKNFMKFRENQMAPEKCRDCEMITLCGFCPGFLKLEHGNHLDHAEILCEIGIERKQAILNYSNGVN